MKFLDRATCLKLPAINVSAGKKSRESLQSRLRNLNSASNDPFGFPSTVSNSNDVIIKFSLRQSAFCIAFSMQTFKFLRCDYKFFFLLRPAARATQRACLQATHNRCMPIYSK